MELDLKKVFVKKEKKKKTKEKLDDELQVMIDSLKEIDGDSEQYGKICDNARKVAEISVLYDQRTGKYEYADCKRKGLDPNTLITAGSYIVGMAMILLFEYDGGVLATRALQFLPKPRI